eukprot:CAMPEP_0118682004 /NCGR_PEP_ID=MMETSP0800-20121206/5252_1 /TAXON_ID=210618 ORGANISM="Striatella unipunctata, Strain CCMP2910" /NCGR_SAMPLE_ID=MMETSP0800 /ASSEMBLY_ACC=CAM_ASM_000638 /LENGTH=386 /DNA_ID=CAMNT_0006578361 /DNA_START=41 /DNA_END=1202 /DNA_ORIENTATION=+
MEDVTTGSDADFLAIYRAKLAARISGQAQDDVRDDDVLACLSYMHTRPKDNDEVVVAPTEKLSAFSAESAFDWLSEGLMPYALLPVLKVSGEEGLSDVKGRLWLKVELTLGLNGSGVWWSDASGNVTDLYNVSDHVVNPDSAVAAVCRSVLAGYTEDLQSFWQEDFLRLQIWSVRILSKDHGPARIAEYTNSATIQYDGPVELDAAAVRKIALELATQDQFSTIKVRTSLKIERSYRAIWTDIVPFIESGGPTRPDRVFYCTFDEGGIIRSLHRYIRFRTSKGIQFVGLPLTETPTGEIIIGLVVGSHTVQLQKMNLPGLTDEYTDLCLALEMGRIGGRSEQWQREFCRNSLREFDVKTLRVLISLEVIVPFDVENIEYVDWEHVY